MNKGFYNDKVIRKFSDALTEAVITVKNGSETRVRISKNNSKMGDVVSVSLLPFITCPRICETTCGAACYAAKLANLRPSVLKSYAINTALAIHKPELFWLQVDLAIKGARFFRFHVSGDILNAAYFENMIKAAVNNPHCEILVFTKRFELVNAYIEKNGSLPENMHVLFSGWNNLKPVNPFNMPETTVYTTDAEINSGWKLCGGNCFECACNGAGCFGAKHGETIAFKKH